MCCVYIDILCVWGYVYNAYMPMSFINEVLLDKSG